ncbi:MAG: glutamine amidotransferase, partial [Georgfuchsia sp.]
MSRHATVLRHIAFEDLDALEPILRSAGFEIEYIETAVHADFVRHAYDADLLIVLGGPIGVYQ